MLVSADESSEVLDQGNIVINLVEFTCQHKTGNHEEDHVLQVVAELGIIDSQQVRVEDIDSNGYCQVSLLKLLT